MSRRRKPGTTARATVDVATLAAETSLSPRTVQRAIRDLIGKGLLSRPGPDTFVIHLDHLEALPRIGEARDG